MHNKMAIIFETGACGYSMKYNINSNMKKIDVAVQQWINKMRQNLTTFIFCRCGLQKKSDSDVSENFQQNVELKLQIRQEKPVMTQRRVTFTHTNGKKKKIDL